ncbi:MAG: cation-translocating P-type ATPase [Burkholderiales bacterium]
MTHTGLSTAEAQRRLLDDGPNVLPAAKPRNTFAIAVEVVREPMFLLLIGGAVIYLLLGDVREALVLAASVVVVMGITVTQERKSERALEALRDLSSPRAHVVRDGVEQRIAGAQVARGDVLILSEGDRVPADAALLSVNGLMVDESLLTGESLPVEKNVSRPDVREGQVFSGTLVIKGQGRAEVAATGSRTEMGRIGVSLATIETGKTSLQIETGRVVRLIATIAVVLCTVLAVSYALLRNDWLAGILAGLTLAMAILPEEFPLVLTVFLALGAWRIGRHGVLTRRIPAVEMLGATTVLCVDKTGTLTENRMSVAEVFYEGVWRKPDTQAFELLEAAALACEIDPFDPMERAILLAAGSAAPSAAIVRREWRLDADYPLHPGFLAICHGWRSPQGGKRVAIKGAPETVLALCALSAAAHARAMEEVTLAAQRGLRLLAVAEAASTNEWLSDPSQYPFHWLGFVALADPLRASVPAAVAECRRAGIRVVMITGDHPGTALAIARQAGIDASNGALTGADIAAMSDAALAQSAKRVQVYARISPEQKLRLVMAYKTDGDVVAMTGDGVNDAPALKAAHIGVAMGLRGTDVAREASSLVLINDDFGSIVETVRLGRRIYRNIRNAMRYIIAVHVPTVGMAFLPLAFGWPLVLFPVHVVFLEFIIDPACSIVFEAEAGDADAMTQPPRDPAQPLFNARTVGASLLAGVAVLIAVCVAYGWVLAHGRSDGEARALAFVAIVVGNLALIISHRSGGKSFIATIAQPNPALWWIVCGTLVALAIAVFVNPVAEIFRFAPLGVRDGLIALVAGVAGVIAVEVFRYARRSGDRV